MKHKQSKEVGVGMRGNIYPAVLYKDGKCKKIWKVKGNPGYYMSIGDAIRSRV